MAGKRSNPDSILDSLAAAYLRLGAADRGVLLAVSGGADSMALLIGTARLADPLRLRVEVASIDHGLRAEAPREVLEVAAVARKLALPFHTRPLALSRGPGVEERARRARYAVLEEIRASAALDLVATAHTASDQAETLLMRLSRGSATRGAAAIRPLRGRVIRPLLEVPRARIERFLAREGVGYARDPTNADRALLRSRVRHDVLPALEEAAGPGVEARLATFAGLALEDEELLSSLAAEALGRVQLSDTELDAVGVRALLPAVRRRVIAFFAERAGVSVDHALVERAVQALVRGGAATLSRGLSLRCAGGRVRVVAPRQPGRPAAEGPAPLVLDGPSVWDDASGLRFSLTSRAPGGRLVATVPASALPLVVRHRQPGDRVGSRKLQDLLVDLKVPAEERDRVPLVCDREGQVVWVVGLWHGRRAGGQRGNDLHLSAEPSTSSSQAREGLLRYRLPGNRRPNTGGSPAVGGRYRKGF